MMEVIDVVDTGRRRRFSVGEKVRIVEERLSGQNLARATARRYGIALSGLYLWRRQYQRGELGGSAPRFRPVEFLPETTAAAALAAPEGGDKVEIVLLNGRMPDFTSSAAKSVVVPWRLSWWVMVAARPFLSRRPGWVRSSAWICVCARSLGPVAFAGALVDTQHQHPARRVEVKPHDCGDLLREHRIVRDIETARDMRLEAGLSPFGGKSIPRIDF